MRRALVLTDESARHPFRASLPPCVLGRAGEVEQAVPWHLRLGLTRDDVGSVLATWAAGFAATLAFIA